MDGYTIDLNNPEPLKRAMRAAAAPTIPAEFVDEVVDLSVHAVHQAFLSMKRVIGTHPNPAVQEAVMATGFSLLAQLAEAKVEEFVEDAKAKGITCHTAEISV